MNRSDAILSNFMEDPFGSQPRAPVVVVGHPRKLEKSPFPKQQAWRPRGLDWGRSCFPAWNSGGLLSLLKWAG